MAEEQKRKKDPYNENNREFKSMFSPLKTRQVIECMRFIGCKSRPVIIEMAMEDFIRKHSQNK